MTEGPSVLYLAATRLPASGPTESRLAEGWTRVTQQRPLSLTQCSPAQRPCLQPTYSRLLLPRRNPAGSVDVLSRE